MLKDFRKLETELQEKIKNINVWPEIEFNSTDKEMLKQLDNKMTINSHSIQTEIDSNHCILPSQYILYAVCLKEFALAVREHVDVLEKYKTERKADQIGEDFEKKSYYLQNLDLDEYSKSLAFKIFTEKSFNFEAKSIINIEKGKYKLRGISDFYGSVILKPINIPAASSSSLEKLIYKLSSYPEIYSYFEKRFIKHIPYITKSKEIGVFIFNLIKFLYQFDNLSRLNSLLVPSEKGFSIKDSTKSANLTSIFWASSDLNESNLTQGGKIRCFKEPIFIEDGKFIFLSTEWTQGKDSRLDLDTLKIILEKYYPEFSIEIKNNEYYYIPQKQASSKASIELFKSSYRRYLTAIKTKPFILLAGISGTGKSRIVRELAQMTCTDDKLKNLQKPGNFEMIQVRPNWHDSTELIGYVTRISGTPQYITTKFLRFLVKAWIYNDIPFFLCLDEMNLAPVEQYFAEYLSVIETRKCFDGEIVTDPIISSQSDGMDIDVYKKLIKELLKDCPDDKIFALAKQFEDEGISIPHNLVVMGTVNMDETTYSFSRKVLDRAMTIEMNHVELDMKAESETDILIDSAYVIGNYARDEDVYTTEENKKYCDKVIGYLKKVNDKLDKTPFKIAYRTRNEFMIYCINALEMTNEKNKEAILTKSLDEMTSMKILSRIEGDRNRTESVLDKLIKLFEDQKFEEGEESITKVLEMKDKLANGYTSYWS